MKEKILPFIKKYPMSILLAIIALILLSIAGSLNTEAELNRMRLDCAKWKGGQEIDLGKKYKLKGILWENWCRLYL